MKRTGKAITAGLALLGAVAQADVVLHTDFTGFTTAGTTISDFAWTSALGEAAGATTSLPLSGSATGFVAVTPDPSGTGPAVGVLGDIETSGPWSTQFTFTPAQPLEIVAFDISSYSINGGGSHQTAPHDVSWALQINAAGTVFSGNDRQTEPGGSEPQAFTIDTTGTTLAAGTTYTFTLTVSSMETMGNNIALDTFTLRTAPSTPPQITAFAADPESVLSNETVTLSWAVTDATALTLSPEIGDVTGLTSTQVVVSADTTYTLTAENANGSTNATTTVLLKTTPPQIDAFTASRTTVAPGGSVILSWAVTDATALTLLPDIGDVTGLTSTQVVITAETTYTLTAENVNGSTNATVTIALGEPDPLVAWWSLEEGTGTTTTEQISGTETQPFPAGASWTLETAGGTPESAAALRFAGDGGTDSGLNANQIGIAGSGDKTIMAWIKTTTTTQSAFFGYSPGNGSVAGGDLRFLINGNGDTTGKLRMEVSSGGFEFGSGFNDGNWHFVAFVIHANDGINDVDVYADGVYTERSGGGTLINTLGEVGSPTINGNGFFLGTDGNASRYYTGDLDDVAIFDQALSATQLDEIRAQGLAPSPPEPVTDLGIAGLATPTPAVVLSWSAESGRSYGVESCTNLVSGSWEMLATGLEGRGEILSITNTIGPEQRFYRIISEP